MEKPQVFISYSRQGESLKITEELERILQEKGLTIVRDKTGLQYKESIKEFMDRLGKGNYVVLVIGDNYLKSEYCMYELLQISRQENFIERIFPIILDDAGISRAPDRKKYTHYWKEEHEKLKQDVQPEDLSRPRGIAEELQLYSEIRQNIDPLTAVLKDINARTLKFHKESKYKEIYRAIMSQYYKDQGMEPPQQIKILAMTASPEEQNPLLYEKEQDTLLDTFAPFDPDEVYLDMPDPVKSTLAEIEDHLVEGHHDILQLTAHGNIDDTGQGILALEDEQGKLDEVPGQTLAQLLQKLQEEKKSNLSLVILTSCHSARKELHLLPTAQALIDAGIPAVIGMTSRISHETAIDFSKGFFTSLKENRDIQTAFQAGKTAVTQGEQKRLRDNPAWDIIGEADIPQLLLKDPKHPLTAAVFSSHRIYKPGRPESHTFQGTKYLDRGFIGRRQQLRRIYNAADQKEGALVLKGPGGIGKSTLTTRAAAFLHTRDYQLLIIRSQTAPETILENLSQKARQLGLKDAAAVVASGNIDIQQKLTWFLENLLFKHHILLIFDNFEDNQDEQGCITDKRLHQFLIQLRDSLKNKNSFLLFSTRFKLPGFTHLEIPEFSDLEYRKMLQKGQALGRLDSQSTRELRHTIGGNPRALELLDRIAKEEYGSRSFTWSDIQTLIPELKDRLLLEQHKEDEFAPLFLDKLLLYLDKEQRQLLEGSAIYRRPVPAPALAALGIQIQRTHRSKLQDLSLLDYQPDTGLVYVHRLIAHFLLDNMTTAMPQNLHQKAARYFAGIRSDEGEKYLENELEARWHWLQAGEWDRAAEVTFEIEYHLSLTGYPQLAQQLLTEIEGKDIDEKNKAITYHLLGILNAGFGDYKTALTQYQKSLEIKEQLGDIKGVSASLFQIGIIYQYKGDYDGALTQYKKSLEISEQLGDRQGISKSLHQIGRIYEEKGDYAGALTQYEKSLEIKEQLGDIKGVSYSLHQIGIIYQEKGDYDGALKQYEQSLEIKEQLGDKKGVSTSSHQIGNIYYLKADYDAALTQYEKSLEIDEQLGDRKGVSTSLFQIGNIYYLKGDYDAALKQYQRVMEIFEQLGDKKGASASLHQIGIIYQNKGDYDRALKHYEKSLEIFEQLGDIKGVSDSLHNIGAIYQAKGDYAGALKQYEKAMEISEQLGDIPGIALSFGQLGNLFFEKEDFPQALDNFLKAWILFTKIGSPTAKHAKQDILRTKEKLPPHQFASQLQQYKLDPALFAEENKGEPDLTGFLVKLTLDVFKTASTPGPGRDQLQSTLDAILDQLPPEAPEAAALKNYIHALQCILTKNNPQPHLSKLPDELKELFENIRKQQDQAPQTANP